MSGMQEDIGYFYFEGMHGSVTVGENKYYKRKSEFVLTTKPTILNLAFHHVWDIEKDKKNCHAKRTRGIGTMDEN